MLEDSILEITTTGLAGGLLLPLQGAFTCRVSRRTEKVPQPHVISTVGLKAYLNPIS